jgi:hypothetical protein
VRQGVRAYPGLSDPGQNFAQGDIMSTDVTMHDLELEHAELLPGRETLYCCKLMPWDGRPTIWRE